MLIALDSNGRKKKKRNMSVSVNIPHVKVNGPSVEEIYSVIEAEMKESGIFSIIAYSDEMYEATMEAISRFGDDQKMCYSVVNKDDMRVIIICTISFYEDKDVYEPTLIHILATAFHQHKLSKEQEIQ